MATHKDTLIIANGAVYKIFSGSQTPALCLGQSSTRPENETELSHTLHRNAFN